MRLLTTNLLNLTRRDDGIKPEIETLDSSFFDKSLPIMLRLLKKMKRGLLLKIRLGAQSKLIRL